MAGDTLASKAVPEAPSENGQAQRVNEQPQRDTDGQTSENGQSAQVKVDENIKNLQRKLSQKDLEAKQALSEAQQAKNLVAQLQQQLRKLEESQAPDDYARLELRLKWAEEQAQYYAQAYQQVLQAQQAEMEKMNALQEIAEEFGVTVDDLKEATDYKSAVKLAIKAQKEREQRKQEQDNDRRERNRVDVGSGTPQTSRSKLEEQWEEARKARNSVEMIRLERLMREREKK